MKALVLLLSLTITVTAQEVRRLDSSEFKQFDKPVTEELLMIPKTANPKVPQPGDITITKSARITVLGNGKQESAPLLDIPILFDVNTANLRDATSRDNVRLLADELIKRSSQGETFSIAGLASAEGDENRNEELSTLRAAKIQQELRALGVPAGTIVKAEGFGSRQAQHKADAPDSLRQLDRRVVVIKEK